MAEGPTGSSPSDDALNKRITDWFNSPQGQQHFKEGFASQARFTLEDFKNRESRRYRFPPKQGGVHEGSSPGKALNVAKCDILGHSWSEAWKSDDKFVIIQECIRCHTMRQQTKQDYGLWQMNENLMTKEQAEQEMLLAEPEPEEGDPSLICIWCGTVCEDLDALGTHEDECEPA